MAEEQCTKVCRKCGEEKPQTAFATGRNHCKACRAAYYRQPEVRARMTEHARRWKSKPENKAKIAAYVSKPEVKERMHEYAKKYYAENIDYYREARQRLLAREEYRRRTAQYAKAWREENRARENERLKRRAVARQKATPVWADVDEMRVVYKFASVLSQATGLAYEVDHIVPLRGKTVCGMHNESNLQVLRAEVNRAKSNRWWPDMPP